MRFLFRFSLPANAMICFLIIGSASGAATVKKIDSAGDLMRGRSAAGKIGDYLLQNERIKVVVDAIANPHGFAASGGNILDAGLIADNYDALNLVMTYFDNTFQRQAVYQNSAIESTAEEARLVVTGHEVKLPRLSVKTIYSLRPGESFLRIRTELVNNGTTSIPEWELGDAIQWGMAEHFAPGVGTLLAGKTLELEWIAGINPRVSYGYAVESGKFSGPNGGTWSDMNVKTVSLMPGKMEFYERFLVIGKGDIASVTDQVYLIRKTPTVRFSGSLVESGTGAPVKGTIVLSNPQSLPVNRIFSEQDGKFAVNLVPGNFIVQGRARARVASAVRPMALELGKPVAARIEIGPAGKLHFRVLDLKNSRATPAKLLFKAIGGTEEPDLGPPYEAAGAHHSVFSATGEGTVDVAPGFYQITAARGIQYSIDQQRIEVLPGRETDSLFKIEKVVQGDFISGDFHLHAENSFDSSIPLADRVISLVAEGVDLAVASDHNFITDYREVVRRLGLQDQIKPVAGDEVTVSGSYHFNAFPLEAVPSKPNNGAVSVQGKTASQLFDEVRASTSWDEILQVNHPRAGDIGYFNTFNLDEQTGVPRRSGYDDRFDALEVFNGRRWSEALLVLQDWFHLLNRGYRYTATGNSDSHQLVLEEAGYPRNLILGVKSINIEDAALVEKVRRHEIVVSNGPMIHFDINGSGVGSEIKNAKTVSLGIRIEAAPWVDVAEVVVVANGEVRDRFLVGESRNPVRWDQTIKYSLDSDTWFVVVVRGLKPLSDVVPPVQGENLYPLAFTNPIWVDTAEDGFRVKAK